ncbi:thiamine pyrophosphate-binding protein [Pelagibacterium sp. 26DY04]|uniref:thiamine pyrophosphate-binding protein n=1 Tax=unclassified Pelagibacterium TaxID=2623280 RepID=UPI002816251C|nr:MULTISPECIES: thiamine pyrophosphate-binding protein [unclassified Pelagibacterium]WMT87540.1 thiamine pyrophosphate-binding protein [Pelagibacterium sp. 26DY04]WMT91690.1 thiamine pyrophosphate-binding protein [Pelagibacterium sp. H642]
MTVLAARNGGRILIDQLQIHGVETVFCVPGESYLAALDALYDSPIAVTVCRQEGGAAMMADAVGKLTGKPGVCFVTRGPGATNAAPAIHIARQDSTPLVLFVGQVARGMREREAFQELDYRAVFGSIAKWVVEIEDPARIPELVARAFSVAASGRPGPVVVALPEDMLTETVKVADALPYRVAEAGPREEDIVAVVAALEAAERPLAILGGTRWDAEAVGQFEAIAAKQGLPVAVSFRRQMLFDANHPNFIGDLGLGANPALIAYAKSADLVLLLGGRLSEIASQSYTLFDIPEPGTKFVHVHPDPEEIGSVYRAEIGIAASPKSFVAALAERVDRGVDRAGTIGPLRESFEAWTTPKPRQSNGVDMGQVMTFLRDTLPPETVMTNGAGNYATWLHRFYRFTRYGTQAAPTSGSMGYCVPAAVGAARIDPKRPVVAFAGDGCFLMNGQEFATAVQYELPIIVIVIDNSMYGTIRMHQERHYPARVVGTELRNPDFAAYAVAFGGHGERVERTEDFADAFERARASGKPAILHVIVDPEALTIDNTLSAIREKALAGQK